MSSVQSGRVNYGRVQCGTCTLYGAVWEGEESVASLEVPDGGLGLLHVLHTGGGEGGQGGEGGGGGDVSPVVGAHPGGVKSLGQPLDPLVSWRGRGGGMGQDGEEERGSC